MGIGALDSPQTAQERFSTAPSAIAERGEF